MVPRGPSEPQEALLELLISPSRASEALLGPLPIDILAGAGALGAHSKALCVALIPRDP